MAEFEEITLPLTVEPAGAKSTSMLALSVVDCCKARPADAGTSLAPCHGMELRDGTNGVICMGWSSSSGKN
jgi:hypothetical protein